MARKERWLRTAESWLDERARALDCWSNGEALVYFMSRGDRLADQYRSHEPEVRAHWHAEQGKIESLIAKGRIVETHPETGEDCPASPRFWNLSSDECEWTTLDATMMRVAEWLGVGGFAETWKRLAAHLCWEASMSGPSDESPAYRLFSLCRLGLTLNDIPEAVKAFLWAVLRGKPNPARPWEIIRHHPDEPAADGHKGEAVGSVAIAAAVAFATARGVADDAAMEQQAQRSLVKRQGESGAWPSTGPYLEDVDSIRSTAMALHVLSRAKPRPRGTRGALEKAQVWIHDQQRADGCWEEDGVDPVYLTVLVLDALMLAAGEDTVTFLSTEPTPPATKRPRRKAGPKPKVPTAAYAEIRKAYEQARGTKALVGEVYDKFVRRFRVSRDTISAIARRKPPYDK